MFFICLYLYVLVFVPVVMYSGLRNRVYVETDILTYLVFYPTVQLFSAVTVLRVWLLYFDMNVSQILKAKIWSHVIDPDFESKQWYFRKQSTFGNAKYLLKFCCLGVLLVTIILFVLYLSELHALEHSVALLIVFVELIRNITKPIQHKSFSFLN